MWCRKLIQCLYQRFIHQTAYEQKYPGSLSLISDTFLSWVWLYLNCRRALYKHTNPIRIRPSHWHQMYDNFCQECLLKYLLGWWRYVLHLSDAFIKLQCIYTFYTLYSVFYQYSIRVYWDQANYENKNHFFGWRIHTESYMKWPAMCWFIKSSKWLVNSSKCIKSKEMCLTFVLNHCQCQRAGVKYHAYII